MSRRYRRRGRNSLGSVVDESAHIASRFGPVGAMATGVVGFTVFYAVVPAALLAWTDANKGKFSGPASTAFAALLDEVMWHRFIHPSQWTGIAMLLACLAVAAWKAVTEAELSRDEISGTSWVAKLLARLFG